MIKAVVERKRLVNTCSPFTLPVRVYYEDTDAGGVVYHSNYLKFMERGRTEFLRCLGYDQHQLIKQKCLFVVADCSVRFRRPGRLDDKLQVNTWLESTGKVRLVFRQSISCGEQLLCEGTFTVGSVHSDTMRPAVILEELRNKCLMMI